MEIYQPKGSMCANCEYKKQSCSHLDFSKMKVLTVLEHNGDKLNIVRCTAFKHDKK